MIAVSYREQTAVALVADLRKNPQVLPGLRRSSGRNSRMTDRSDVVELISFHVSPLRTRTRVRVGMHSNVSARAGEVAR